MSNEILYEEMYEEPTTRWNSSIPPKNNTESHDQCVSCGSYISHDDIPTKGTGIKECHHCKTPTHFYSERPIY